MQQAAGPAPLDVPVVTQSYVAAFIVGVTMWRPNTSTSLCVHTCNCGCWVLVMMFGKTSISEHEVLKDGDGDREASDSEADGGSWVGLRERRVER